MFLRYRIVNSRDLSDAAHRMEDCLKQPATGKATGKVGSSTVWGGLWDSNGCRVLQTRKLLILQNAQGVQNAGFAVWSHKLATRWRLGIPAKAFGAPRCGQVDYSIQTGHLRKVGRADVRLFFVCGPKSVP
jgi:hypothetical protein